MRSLIDRNLTVGSISKNIWFLAVPMILTSFLQDFFSIVDMFFVGRLGPSAIAAVSMGGVIIGIIMVAVMGISVGAIALVSRYIGRKDSDSANNVVMQSLLLALMFSLVVMILGYIFAEPLLRLLGAEKDVINLGSSYIKILALGSPTIFLTVMMFSSLRGAGDPISPMIVLVVSTLLNIILDPLLIFGIGFFPELGVAGSAVATVIGRGAALPFIFWVLYSGRSNVRLRKSNLRPDTKTMGQIIKIGLFGSLEMIVMNITMLILMSTVAQYGTNVVAAYGIGMRLNMAVTIPIMGIGFAAATLVGQNLGALKVERSEKSGWLCALYAVIIMCVLSTFLFAFPEEIIGIFNRDGEIKVLRVGASFLRFVAPSLLFVGLGMTLGRSQNGAGDTQIPLLTSTITFLGLRIPLAFLLSSLLGPNGIWLDLAITNVVYGILMTTFFKIGRWKKKKL
ncbi:MAG TPA: MATE family efflux transporter [Thermoplasmata archaeon]|nr:MATE family efflux transporter [Thermoplasmata archaeon]